MEVAVLGFYRMAARPFCARIALVIAAIFVLAGCATAPVREVRFFNSAFVSFSEASQPLFDDLAMAERRQGQENAVIKTKNNLYTGDCKGIVLSTASYIDGFCIDDAYYFSELSDPPATRGFRNGIRLIGRYAEILVTLAEGQNVNEASAQIQALGSHIGALASLASGPGAGAAFSSALTALDPIIREAAQKKNIEEMNRLVFTGAPHVKKILMALKDGAPAVFNTLTYQASKAVVAPEALTSKTAAKVQLDRIAAYRIAVSNYVVMLGELERTFDELLVVVQQPRSSASLALVAERSAHLSAYADNWRRVYSALRGAGT